MSIVVDVVLGRPDSGMSIPITGIGGRSGRRGAVLKCWLPPVAYESRFELPFA